MNMIVFKIYQEVHKCDDKVYGIQSLVEAVMFAITSGDDLLADIPPLMRMTCTFKCQIDWIVGYNWTTGQHDHKSCDHTHVHYIPSCQAKARRMHTAAHNFMVEDEYIRTI